MDETILPEAEYYSIEMLARKWGCHHDDVLHYGCTGQLKMCVLSDGWDLEGGYYEEVENGGYFTVPDKRCFSLDELLQVSARTIREIVKEGEVKNPQFFAPDTRFLWLNPCKYDLEEPREDTYPPIVITVKDLMIKNIDRLNFESEYKANNQSPEMVVPSNYTTPYIKLMLQAIKEKEITIKNQGKAEDLCEWFMLQKIEGENISKSAAQKMATFIRLPESRKGGNKPFRKG